MAEFEVAGVEYKSRRMSAMTEESVVRKLAPMINLAIPALAAMKNGMGKVDMSALPQAHMIEALTSTIAGLTDASTQHILASCLGVVERRNGDVWAPVWSASGGRPMFDDIRAPQMYLIAAKVLEDAFRDFMQALGPSFLRVEGNPEATTQSGSPTG